MDRSFYSQLAENGIEDRPPSRDMCQQILMSPEIDLLPLLDAAFEVRKTFHGREVAIHIINNAQNGHCPEDCHYCSQSRVSKADIEKYGTLPTEQLIDGARFAVQASAKRYCMVTSGRGPVQEDIDHFVTATKAIKSEFPHLDVSNVTCHADQGDSISLIYVDQNKRLEKQTGFMNPILPADVRKRNSIASGEPTSWPRLSRPLSGTSGTNSVEP